MFELVTGFSRIDFDLTGDKARLVKNRTRFVFQFGPVCQNNATLAMPRGWNWIIPAVADSVSEFARQSTQWLIGILWVPKRLSLLLVGMLSSG